MSNTEEYRGRFEELIELVSDANAKIASGVMIELGSLDEDVAKLCEEVEAGDDELKQHVQPLMVDLISRLDELAQTLAAVQGEGS